jgi:hypothetical protein
MRIVRNEFERQWARPFGTDEREPFLTGESALETRIWFNRFETKLILAALWIRNEWFERVTCRLGRLNCRLFRHHNLTCRGRRDHSVLGQGLIDPDRWSGWPRR